MKRSYRKSDAKGIGTIVGLGFCFASLLILLSLLGCAPSITPRKYEEAKKDFGPLQRDTDLGLSNLKAQNVDAGVLQWRESIESARVLRAAETLVTLGELRGRPGLMELGRKLSDSFYQAEGAVTRQPLEQTLFASAAIGETQIDSLKLIDDNDELMVQQSAFLLSLLQQVGAKFPWPGPQASARDLFDAAEGYVDAVVQTAGQGQVDPRILDALIKALNKKFYPIIRDARLEVASILNEPRALEIIRRFIDITNRNGFAISPTLKARLAQAQIVMSDIENIKKTQHALKAIVELWELTTPEDHEKKFKPVSKDLYGYLKGKSHDELACVKDDGCHNPLIWLPKNLIILPAIEDYGVDKIRTELSQQSRDGLIAEIQAQVAAVVPQLPVEAGKRIVQEIADVRGKLKLVKDDYPGFVRRIMKGYAGEKLRGLDASGAMPADISIVGFETSRIQIDFTGTLLAMRSSETSGSVVTGAETIGTSMALAATLWRTETVPGSVSYQRSVISQINKLLAIGGFKAENQKPFPSLSLALDPSSEQRHFYVRHFSSGTVGYAVPDSIRVNNDVQIDSALYSQEVSVRSQAELLRGLSSLIRSFRDWEKSPFDQTLGRISVGELIKDLPADGVTEKLFPKEMFFSLAVADAGSILKNLTKKLSPVFLLSLKNNVIWSNDLGDTSDDNDPATMAGMVDIQKGERTDTVRTGDVANYLLAVSEFLEATEGIENTKASPLLEKGADGHTPLEQLLDGKRDIRLLALGLANFLSHRMQGADGGLRSALSRANPALDAKAPRTLRDQALAILALSRVGDALDKDVYRWAAMDAMAFMNKVLWNTKTGFYRSVEGSEATPPLDEVALALLAGERLRLQLNEKSRTQWDQISAPWYAAFEKL